MPTALQGFRDSRITAPNWAAEQITAKHLIPGGAKVAPAAFAATPSFKVEVSAAGAVLGATAIPVVALPVTLPAGTTLDFGILAAETVVVSGTPADNAVALAVNALTRAIPSGTYLDFGTGKFAVTNAAAAIGATSLTVLAMPAGSKPVATDDAVLPAGRKLAVLTATANTAATSVTVSALTFQAVDADEATYAGAGSRVQIPAGTLLGRTYAERDADTPFGSWVVGDTDGYLLAYSVVDALEDDDITLVRHQVLVKENGIPGFADLSADAKTFIRANYQTVIGGDQ